MKRLPYRNTTYQIIRSCFDDPKSTFMKASVVSHQQLFGLTGWKVTQFITSKYEGLLHSTDAIQFALSDRGLLVFEFITQTKCIGTDLYRRTCWFLTGLKSAPDAPRGIIAMMINFLQQMPDSFWKGLVMPTGVDNVDFNTPVRDILTPEFVRAYEPSIDDDLSWLGI